VPGKVLMSVPVAVAGVAARGGVGDEEPPGCVPLTEGTPAGFPASVKATTAATTSAAALPAAISPIRRLGRRGSRGARIAGCGAHPAGGGAAWGGGAGGGAARGTADRG
jgi:hypothetical protein